jgi:hypothetical protein
MMVTRLAIGSFKYVIVQVHLPSLVGSGERVALS